MKIIFLDIDGVLNNLDMYNNEDDKIKTPSGLLSKKNLTVFNQLVGQTDAKIVISSTWRTDDGVEAYLTEAGVEGEIIGKTPKLNTQFMVRGNEIHAWIVEHKELLGMGYDDYSRFVILDDGSDMLYWHKENLFQTDSWTGLTPNIAYRAAKFLNRP